MKVLVSDPLSEVGIRILQETPDIDVDVNTGLEPEELKKYESDNLRRFKRLDRLSKKSEDKEQFAAAINAEYRSGQLAGAYVDKREVRVSGLEGMSREELESKLKELSEKIDGYNAKTVEAEVTDVSEES